MKDPRLWGTSAWNFIHHVTVEFPNVPTPLDKQRYTNFINGLRFVLPCHTCRKHFTYLLQKNPIHYFLHNTHSFMKWGWTIHNAVNKRLGKKFFSWIEFEKKYIRNQASFSYFSLNKNKIISYFLLLLILLVIIYSVVSK